MFKGRVERISHEGGLLVSYSGACPALDSVMVDSNENYVGKVDGVVGNLDNSLVHVAHLDRKNDANSMIGIEITIRARHPKQDRPQRRDNDRDNRQSRDNDRRNDRRGGDRHDNNDWECSKCNNSNFAFRTECNRCGESKGTGGERRNDRRPKFDNRRDRNDNERHGNNDWECSKCNNSNFAFRTECNRCGESKGTGGDRRNERSPKFEKHRDKNDNDRHGKNDWECSKCNNSNFSFRTECNRCGEPKGRDSGSRNDRRPQRGERRGRERNPRQNDRRSKRDDDRKPRRDGREWSGNERRRGDRGSSSPTPQAGDWDCPQCGKSNFAKRTECFSCGRSKRIGGARRKGHHFSRDPSPLRSHRYGKGDRRRDE